MCLKKYNHIFVNKYKNIKLSYWYNKKNYQIDLFSLEFTSTYI